MQPQHRHPGARVGRGGGEGGLGGQLRAGCVLVILSKPWQGWKGKGGGGGGKSNTKKFFLRGGIIFSCKKNPRDQETLL